MIGAISATTMGTVGNHFAALLLIVGTIFISAYCGLAWAARADVRVPLLAASESR